MMVEMVGVRFKRACKVYDFDRNGIDLNPGDVVIVQVEKGLGMGTVVYGPKGTDPARRVRKLKKVVRKADAVDMDRRGFNAERETEAYRICKEKIEEYGLPMKLIRVEYLFDSSKAIFYFTSETRVDFRGLVKDLASGFHTRIEMRQIGVRDEAKMVGGLGPCGRELCCSGFLSDFTPVTIKMAKEQNLALNPVKISGICGRLMCCLSYEHGAYKGAARAGRAGKDARKKAGCGGCPRPEGPKGPRGPRGPGGPGGPRQAPKERAPRAAEQGERQASQERSGQGAAGQGGTREEKQGPSRRSRGRGRRRGHGRKRSGGGGGGGGGGQNNTPNNTPKEG